MTMNSCKCWHSGRKPTYGFGHGAVKQLVTGPKLIEYQIVIMTFSDLASKWQDLHGGLNHLTFYRPENVPSITLDRLSSGTLLGTLIPQSRLGSRILVTRD